jgi:hypothetical protein
VLMDDNGPVEELNIIGKITDQGVTATVNKNLHIDYAERKLGINSHGFAFNLPNLIDVVKGRQQAVDDNQDKQTGLFLSFTAENSNLYLSPNSKILADRIELEYLNDTIKMRLLHGPGKIVMKVEEEQFLVNGSNLDETFMGALIQNSRFQGGQFSIAAMGRSDEFSVLFEIRDTVLLDFTILNNVMALLNTVPSLVSFSLPEYDFTGLPLDSAVVGMRYNNKFAAIESMEFISPSLQAKGIGEINFSQRHLDLDLNLTTQRKENIRKIPAAGYILQGEEGESSMTIKIKGDLDDPDVGYSLFKEIAAKPFEILFRVLKLPVHLLEELDSESEGWQQTGPALEK